MRTVKGESSWMMGSSNTKSENSALQLSNRRLVHCLFWTCSLASGSLKSISYVFFSLLFLSFFAFCIKICTYSESLGFAQVLEKIRPSATFGVKLVLEFRPAGYPGHSEETVEYV